MNGMRTYRGKKVLLFDWNDTLTDERESARRGFQESLEELLGDMLGRWSGAENKGIDADHTYEKFLREERRLQRLHTRQPSPATRFRLALTKALGEYPFELSDRFVDTFYRQWRLLTDEKPVLRQQAAELLADLAQAHALGIVSNTDRAKVLRALEGVRLDRHFQPELIVSPKNRGERKPSPAMFRRAAAAAKAATGECVMVGNAWTKDIAGAAAAGMDAVWLRPGAKPNAAGVKRLGGKRIIVIRSLDDLKPLFL